MSFKQDVAQQQDTQGLPEIQNGALNISGNNQFHKSLTIKASARNTTTATESKIKIFFILDNP